jgi:hypothetical protein
MHFQRSEPFRSFLAKHVRVMMNELNSRISRRRLIGATAAAAAPFMAAAQATPEASPLAEDALLSSTQMPQASTQPM